MFQLTAIILLIVGGIGFFISLEIVDNYYFKDEAVKEKRASFAACAFAILFLLGVILTCVSVDQSKKMISTTEEWQSVSSDELHDFKDAVNTSGAFFLGSGSTDGTTYYYYYTETKDGYLLNKINTNEYKVYINYCEKGQMPYIERLRPYTVKKVKDKRCWLWNIKALKKHTVGDVLSKTEKATLSSSDCYKAYLPEGSIVGTYEVDLK